MYEQMLQAQRPVEASTMFIDMDSFFASVEQQANPALRGQPVAVCPCLGPGCMVVAASREAKALGIRLGTRVAEARQICPDIALISDSPTSYRQVHHQIMAILEDTPCLIRPRSIDEAWLKLPSYLVGSHAAHQLAGQIKADIRAQIGEYVGASIGIAPNIWLAKMAATARKPDGLFELRLSDLDEFYSGLRLQDLNGISWRLARQCYKMGIQTPRELAAASYSRLQRAWGVNGAKWYLRLRGYEVDIGVIKPQQTMSHQTTIMPAPATTVAEISAILAKMSYRLGQRLRHNSQMAHGIGLHLGYAQGAGAFRRGYRSPQAFSSNYWIMHHAQWLLSKWRAEGQPVQRVSLVLYDLVDELQMPLEMAGEETSELALSRAIDELNGRYGAGTVIPASTLGRDIFPDRVGFGNSRS